MKTITVEMAEFLQHTVSIMDHCCLHPKTTMNFGKDLLRPSPCSFHWLDDRLVLAAVSLSVFFLFCLFPSMAFRSFCLSSSSISSSSSSSSGTSAMTLAWIQSCMRFFLALRSTVVSMPYCVNVNSNLFFSSTLLWKLYMEGHSPSSSGLLSGRERRIPTLW